VQLVNGYEVNILLEMKSMLRPLESVTRELSADKFVTISKIIPLINCTKLQIEKLCDENESVSEKIRLFKKALNDETGRFGKAEHVERLAFATLLDPRYKKIHFKDNSAMARWPSLF
jgi:hypothetical protein